MPRTAPVLVPALLAGIAIGLSACADAPDLDRLAPTMPRLQAEVPETRHPETEQAAFPNINNMPDRDSSLHGEKELEEIEKSLEEVGADHVNEAVTTITGKPPPKSKSNNGNDNTGAAKKKPAATSSGSGSTASDGPLQLTPLPSDEQS